MMYIGRQPSFANKLSLPSMYLSSIIASLYSNIFASAKLLFIVQSIIANNRLNCKLKMSKWQLAVRGVLANPHPCSPTRVVVVGAFICAAKNPKRNRFGFGGGD